METIINIKGKEVIFYISQEILDCLWVGEVEYL